VASSFPHGTVHEAREDLQAALQSDPKVFGLWESLTPLGRNEFICWVDDAKQPTTRQRRIERTCDELLEGKKRPCCWAGCNSPHRQGARPLATGPDRSEEKEGRINRPWSECTFANSKRLPDCFPPPCRPSVGLIRSLIPHSCQSRFPAGKLPT
jgi:hypothetical protein